MPGLILFAFIFITALGHDIFRPRGDFYRIKCDRRPLLARDRAFCSRFAANFTDAPNSPQNFTATKATPVAPKFSVPQILANFSANPKVPKIVAKAGKMAQWLKVVIGIFTSLFAIYTAGVSILKFRQRMGIRRALSLGLLGPKPGDQVNLDHSEPIELGPRSPRTI